MQEGVQPYLPDWFGPFTGQLTFWGFFISMGAMRMEIVSPSHAIWRVGYFVGALSFLCNLLVQINVGNVALEIALVVVTVRKLLAPKTEAKASEVPWRWRWLAAPVIMGAAYWAGVESIHLWPHNCAGLLSQDGWSSVSLFGAAALLLAVVLQLNGLLDGNGWRFAMLYAIGTVSLVGSYLGQPSDAGLRLNVTMTIMLVASIIIVAIRKKQSKA
jgi:hypothetical protein